MDSDKHARIAHYQQACLDDHGFERTMVAARHRMALELLAARHPAVVLEIGCGLEPLYAKVAAAGLPVHRWVTVEPAGRFVDAARAAAHPGIALELVHGFFEDKADEARRACGRSPDLILAAGLLSELERPRELLDLVRQMLVPDTTVHVSVANAFSLHRRLARAMGLIADERTPSARNLAFAQFHVYDLEQLAALVASAGMRVEAQGGYFIKPFTHAQMESIAPVLTPAVLSGLWELGREHPQLASEIYVNAGLP